MPLLPNPLSARWRLALALSCCAFAAGGPGAAVAADHAGHGAAAEAASPTPAAKADPPVPAAVQAAAAHRPAPRTAAAGAARDPMDVVRERLAEKLGATKAPDAPNPNVLRVVSRAAAAETLPARTAAAAHGAAAARQGSAGHAAAGAGGAQAAVAGHGHGHGAGAAPVATAAATPMAAQLPHAAHWDYQGAGGPDAWGQLKPEFSKCASGTRQSPIDIRDGVKVQLDEVRFDYRPSGFRVVDNGHTVQVNVAAGNSIEVLGRRYDLLQFHFHRPSEERINGRQFEMVAHLVHKDLEGRLAVVAVLLDRGAAQPVVQTVWNNLPLEKGEEVAAQTAIDLNALLPPDRSYYTYMGSLTTPPCSEGVLWMVLKNPVPVSPQQVSIFSRLYPMNARPIQSASGRLIKESN